MLLPASLSEQDIIKRIQRDLPENERLFRANSGQGYTGKPVFLKNGVLKLLGYRVFHGMPEGTPDLIGWRSIEITPDMVGQRIAVFYGCEVKATGRLSKAQEKFGEVLTRMGGIFEVIKK